MNTTALLVMDVQRGIVDRYAQDAGYLARLRRAVDAARTADIRIIYVTVRFRPGYPEVSPRNKSFATLSQTTAFSEGDPATAIHPDVAPAPGDILVTKRRVSAFAGSNFDVVLRAANIDTLVLTGIATSGVVLSTLPGRRPRLPAGGTGRRVSRRRRRGAPGAHGEGVPPSGGGAHRRPVGGTAQRSLR